MMSVTWTNTQKQRLSELDAEKTLYDQVFASTTEREKHFKQLEQKLAARNRDELLELKDSTLRPVSYTHLDVYKRQTRAMIPVFLARRMLCGADCWWRMEYWSG